MQALLRGFDSPDIENLGNYHPQQADHFGFLLQLYVGASNSDGFEMFTCSVCTPSWINGHYANHEILVGHRFIIVFEYNYERLYERLNQIVSGIKGETWQEIACKVNVIARWEFSENL